MRVLANSNKVSQLIGDLSTAVARSVAAAGAGAKWALVGVRSRGDVLAHRLAEQVDAKAFGGRVGTLDITLYRDDLSEIARQPIVRTTEIPFDLNGLHIVLVDDVLMSGRSIRAALQSLMDLGRPKRVWLAVLVDRGGRELPIAPDHVGMDLSDGSLKTGDRVDVYLRPTDDRDAIVLRSEHEQGGVQA